MAIFHFNPKDVKRCIEHTLSAEKQSRPWYLDDGDEIEPNLILVKDEGIYIMSGGLPRDVVGENRSFAAYATGFDPKDYKSNPDELWDYTYSISRDDFAEYFPVSSFNYKAFLEDKVQRFRIRFSDDEIEFVIMLKDTVEA